jgi:hypothetical protein
MNNQKELYPEDIMMVAVKHEVTERYVKMVMYGERDFSRSEKAQLISEDLELLAQENITYRVSKQVMLGVAIS